MTLLLHGPTHQCNVTALTMTWSPLSLSPLSNSHSQPLHCHHSPTHMVTPKIVTTLKLTWSPPSLLPLSNSHGHPYHSLSSISNSHGHPYHCHTLQLKHVHLKHWFQLTLPPSSVSYICCNGSSMILNKVFFNKPKMRYTPLVEVNQAIPAWSNRHRGEC